MPPSNKLIEYQNGARCQGFACAAHNQRALVISAPFRSIDNATAAPAGTHRPTMGFQKPKIG
jgi:hypothetical protein